MITAPHKLGFFRLCFETPNVTARTVKQSMAIDALLGKDEENMKAMLTDIRPTTSATSRWLLAIAAARRHRPRSGTRWSAAASTAMRATSGFTWDIRAQPKMPGKPPACHHIDNRKANASGIGGEGAKYKTVPMPSIS
jgi:hypothetical protein